MINKFENYENRFLLIKIALRNKFFYLFFLIHGNKLKLKKPSNEILGLYT